MSKTKALMITFTNPHHIPLLSLMTITVTGQNKIEWMVKLCEILEDEDVTLYPITDDEKDNYLLTVGGIVSYIVEVQVLYNVY